MMIGSFRWNLTIAIIAAIMTVWFATMNHNPWPVVIVRSLTSFVVLFVLTYLFRFLIALIVGERPESERRQSAEEQSDMIGASVDLATPAEDISWPLPNQEAGKETASEKQSAEPSVEQSAQSFQAFEPPNIILKDPSQDEVNVDPQTAVKAIRRLTED